MNLLLGRSRETFFGSVRSRGRSLRPPRAWTVPTVGRTVSRSCEGVNPAGADSGPAGICPRRPCRALRGSWWPSRASVGSYIPKEGGTKVCRRPLLSLSRPEGQGVSLPRHGSLCTTHTGRHCFLRMPLRPQGPFHRTIEPCKSELAAPMPARLTRRPSASAREVLTRAPS